MSRLRVAVVGVGYLGRFHAQKYAAMDDVDLVAVVDVDQGRAQEVARELGTVACTSIDHIGRPLDAASVAVPTSSHAEVAVRLLERGVAVLVEKPMASSLADARAIVEASRKTGAILQVGHLERFNPALVKLKHAISEPMFIEAHRISPYRSRGTDVDVILDIMIHDLDIILDLVPSPVASIEAVGVNVLTEGVDIANARLRFANGCIANITASRVSADVMRKIRIFQKNSYISIDFAKAKADVYTLSPDRRIEHEHYAMSESDALAAEIRSFVDAVRERTEVAVDGEAGLRAMEAALLVKEHLVVPGK
ncbi:MAG TPA: Gfo/Idh/MocA family oxidoreductase [Deltaproteobacteria bacterium]|nr:Gfo/Idh/MocA family oxidoreductase [Deltaproteobacteria bacterium]HOM29299.1 Gfo/Idh/MocA family oxidoreductase [Deltaproteobacteria bacterium]